MTVIYLQHPTICHGGWHHIRSFSPPLHPLWGLFEPLTAAGDTATLCLGDEWVPNGCGAWLKKNHWCPDLKKTRLTWLNKYAFHDVHGLSLWKKNTDLSRPTSRLHVPTSACSMPVRMYLNYYSIIDKKQTKQSLAYCSMLSTKGWELLQLFWGHV